MMNDFKKIYCLVVSFICIHMQNKMTVLKLWQSNLKHKKIIYFKMIRAQNYIFFNRKGKHGCHKVTRNTILFVNINWKLPVMLWKAVFNMKDT